jgi:hypothetical protein
MDDKLKHIKAKEKSLTAKEKRLKLQARELQEKAQQTIMLQVTADQQGSTPAATETKEMRGTAVNSISSSNPPPEQKYLDVVMPPPHKQ